jgi:hypothetical protein
MSKFEFPGRLSLFLIIAQRTDFVQSMFLVAVSREITAEKESEALIEQRKWERLIR